jgi:glycosyltransferase involved in cell wall biosynthesis
MNNPLVSIIVPCYNQAQYLNDALQSVLDQTYPHWECIIINDGSLDNTNEVAEKWVANDNRFIYLYKKNGGLSSARNLGIENAKGSYIQFLDSDDFLLNAKLELSLQQIDLKKNKGVKVAITNFRMFIDNPLNSSAPYCNLKEELFNFESLVYQWEESFTIPIHCGFFNVLLFKGFRFSENLKAKEDWVMWVSLFHKDCKAVFIEEPLVLYRKNPNSMTMTKNMLPDFINAYCCFRQFLSEEEYHQFSILLISRYYKSSQDLKKRMVAIKDSNSYQTGLMIKKCLKKMSVLRLCKSMFLIILRFKSK